MRLESRAIQHYSELDKPRENCAVFGELNFDGSPAAQDVMLGLASLQHRGQDGSGAAAFHDYAGRFYGHKDRGLVADVFDRAVIENNQLDTNLVIGHNRYATAGKKGEQASDTSSLQPFIIEKNKRSLAIAHNGNIPNKILEELRAQLPKDIPFQSESDSEVLGWLIMTTPGRSWEEKIANALKKVKGGYALVIATDKNQLIGVRDDLENRPLWWGKTDKGIVMSSETHGFERLPVREWQEVRGGEMVIASGKERSVKTLKYKESDRTARCLVENVYFAHPTSQDNGYENWEIRQRMGEMLAREHPLDTDIICGIPESGLYIAEGYAAALKRHPQAVVVKDRYRNGVRTFIQGTDAARKNAIEAKFSVSRRVQGKSVTIIDDSVIRANTTRILVQRLREKGASAVHVLSGSPHFRHQCDLGVDIAGRDELAALERRMDGSYRNRTDEEIADMIGADSVHFLSLQGLSEAIGRPQGSLCTHCLTGEHPIFDAKKQSN